MKWITRSLLGVLAALGIGVGLLATSGTASADCPGCTNTATMTAANVAEVNLAAVATSGDTNVFDSAFVEVYGGDANAIASSYLKQKNLQFLIQANVGDATITLP
jgi:hypothetical protein